MFVFNGTFIIYVIKLIVDSFQIFPLCNRSRTIFFKLLVLILFKQNRNRIFLSSSGSYIQGEYAAFATILFTPWQLYWLFF